MKFVLMLRPKQYLILLLLSLKLYPTLLDLVDGEGTDNMEADAQVPETQTECEAQTKGEVETDVEGGNESEIMPLISGLMTLMMK